MLRRNQSKSLLIWFLMLVALMLGYAAPAIAQKKPHSLVIFGNDVGQSNISAYTHGLVGYKTPNIDRMAQEGMVFTNHYAENSGTAERSTHRTGES